MDFEDLEDNLSEEEKKILKRLKGSNTTIYKPEIVNLINININAKKSATVDVTPTENGSYRINILMLEDQVNNSKQDPKINKKVFIKK